MAARRITSKAAFMRKLEFSIAGTAAYVLTDGSGAFHNGHSQGSRMAEAQKSMLAESL
jgi:hypothetical protein